MRQPRWRLLEQIDYMLRPDDNPQSRQLLPSDNLQNRQLRPSDDLQSRQLRPSDDLQSRQLRPCDDNWVISYDPVMTRLSSVKELSDVSYDPTDDKWRPDYFGRDWSDDSCQN